MTADQQFILALIAAVGTLIASVAGVYVQIRNLRVQIDGRMQQLLDLTATSSKAEGVLEHTEAVASVPGRPPGPRWHIAPRD